MIDGGAADVTDREATTAWAVAARMRMVGRGGPLNDERRPMSHLTDCELTKISDLLATGSMENASEIVRLLKVELREEPRTHLGSPLFRALGEVFLVRAGRYQ
jgi:hypothetical protein